MKSLLILILALLPAVPSVADLRIGAAAVVITPAMGTPLAGYYTPRAADAVHDDLMAKAIVLEQDGSKVALVACDLIGLPRPIVLEARKVIEQNVGIPPDHVMISATHTHTGPQLPIGSARDPSEGDAGVKSQQYAASLPELIARAVKEADGRLASVTLRAGMGREEHLSFNRRFFMKDGTVGWNAGKLNPNIIRPAGPIDPDVPVLLFELPGGKPLVTYVNFAMHLDTVGGAQISADYPGVLSRLLAQVKGPDMLTVFSTGTCGDINHVDVSTREPQKGPEEAARIGTILAAEVLKTYRRLDPVTPAAPRVRSQIVQLALPDISGENLAAARRLAVNFGKGAPTFIQRVNAFKVIDVASRDGRPHDVEVQVIALGDDVALVSLPGEIFVELGQTIKRASPFKHTILVELANGSIGYIPTRRAYAEGNYEPVSARCAAGSGEQLVETALKLLNDLKK